MINQNLLHLLNKFPFLCKESGAVQPRGSADPGAAARLPAAGGAAAHRHARQEQEVLRHLHHQRPPRQFHFKGEEGEQRPRRQRPGAGRGGQGRRRQGQQTCQWQVRPSTIYLSVITIQTTFSLNRDLLLRTAATRCKGGHGVFWLTNLCRSTLSQRRQCQTSIWHWSELAILLLCPPLLVFS